MPDREIPMSDTEIPMSDMGISMSDMEIPMSDMGIFKSFSSGHGDFRYFSPGLEMYDIPKDSQCFSLPRWQCGAWGFYVF